jgi:carbonic anhydrase
VHAAYSRASLGLIDNWLRHVQDVRDRHEALIALAPTEEERVDRLCELNVVAQVRHVCHTTIVQDAWRRQQPLAVHGWIYALRDGLLRDLRCTSTGLAEIDGMYAQAVEYVTNRATGSGRPDA